MICLYCRNPEPEGSTICSKCGAPLKEESVQPVVTEPVQPVEPAVAPVQEPQTKPKKNNSWIIILLIIIVLVVLGIVFVPKLFAPKTSPEPEPTPVEIKEPDNKTEITGTFKMTIDDIFVVTEKGLEVTGKIESGIIKTGDEVEIVGEDNTIKTKVKEIEMFRKTVDEAKQGDQVGLILEDVQKDDIQKGQIVRLANTEKEATNFEATIRVNTKDEGGRNTPIFKNYQPQFKIGEKSIKGKVSLPEGTQMIMPGKEGTIIVELESKTLMKIGTEFEIIDGEKIVAKGTITKVD